jgi:dTDP-L-rhamnose 4-epimerase
MDKVLVTGGAGFIGQRTVRALLRAGYDVRVLDRLNPPVHPDGAWPAGMPDVECIRGDVRDPADLRRALRDARFVMHLSAYQDYLPDFSNFLSSNATSTALLYELIVAERLPVEKVVIASSQSVYGEGAHVCTEHGVQFPDGRPMAQLRAGDWEISCSSCGAEMTWKASDERHHHPQNAYAISKLSQELIGITLGRRCEIPTTALRYSITQGAGQSFHNAYSGICRIFASCALQGKPLRVYEDGGQQRDYVYVEDVVAANLLALRDRRLDGQVFNVGGASATSVLEYARLVSDVVGVEPRLERRGDFRVGDSRHIVSDSSRLRALGWRQTRSARDIVVEYVSWLREQPLAERLTDTAYQTMRQLGAVGVSTSS